ncbi:MAG TPA: 4-alpha-glucanotransferase [Rectinemataceae bacterium]|nr:4-alpha-glucanotransferase [Rectinemataceae bacterium]
MKFLHPAKRTTGYVLPLLSLKTGKGPCGEFPDIVDMARLARSWNMDVVQLLPVNDTGWQTSPYSALSAFALNPVYLRIGDLPELKRALDAPGGSGNAVKTARGTPEEGQAAAIVLAREKAERLALDFGSATKVPYAAILEKKLNILESLWNALSSGVEGQKLIDKVEAWSIRASWAKPYACFVELKRRAGGRAWWEWPDNGTVDKASIESLWNEKGHIPGTRFWAWLQMRAEEQFALACAQVRDLGVDIMGDIPILMNADSADVWFHREYFDTGRAAGAPPDMYSRYGQNWGFPLYRWDEIERSGYSFWKERLRCAEKFYTLYRIDHVLGFFRIWAIGKYEADGFLGHFMPEFSLSYPELDAIGFDAGRIRWLSKPHVPQRAIDDALAGFSERMRGLLRARLFAQIGDEPLYLFAQTLRGGTDIAAIVREAAAIFAGENVLRQAVSSCIDALLFWWRNRTLLEIAPGQFVATWEFRDTQAWASLSDHEKSAMEALISRRKGESLALWERTGRKLLKTLADSVDMQACAEDLGAVPPCVPAVLGELGIPGLKVLRWHRAWDRPDSPYVPLDEYPEESVACMSVHDSTNLRQWWEEEADREELWRMARQALGREAAKTKAAGRSIPRQPLADAAPATLDPDSALLVLRAFAAARSRCVVYPLQDLLAASALYREENPADERVNVPGTMSDANWLYRMKPRLEELMGDAAFAVRIASLTEYRL